MIALLLMLAGTCITGYMMTTDAFWGAKWVEAMKLRQPGSGSSSSMSFAFSSRSFEQGEAPL